MSGRQQPGTASRAWQAADAPTTSTCTTSSALTPTTPIKDTVEALRQLIDASEIRHVGLSEAAPGRSAGLTSCTRFETVDAEVGAAPARVALARLSAIRPSAGDRYADMSPING